MNNSAVLQRLPISTIIVNLAGFLLIYFTPALSHMLHVPLYFAEPMRIMVILAMVHSNRSNAFWLAASLPLFSFLVSAHPVFYKMLLISAELLLNVYLFYALKNRIKQKFVAMFTAIIISKGVYYGLKALLVAFVVLQGDIFATPLFVQLIMTLIFSTYTALVMMKLKTS